MDVSAVESAAFARERREPPWKRWPCPRCGHRGRTIAIVCPECEALPWSVGPSGQPASGPSATGPSASGPSASEPPTTRGPAPGIAGQILRPGVELEVRREGFLPRRHRFSTPAGFLGVLTYRTFGGADWLGADGIEWRLGRVGLLRRTYVLLAGATPIAAAEARGVLWQARYQIWQENRTYVLTHIGLTRHNFLLAVEDGPEVLRIQGGWINPLRRFEVLSEVPLATVVLAGYLGRRIRHGEGE